MSATLERRESLRNLKHFPVLFFASVMGLSGFAIVVQTASADLSLPGYVPRSLAYFALAVFVLITLTYLTKLVLFPSTVMREALHPSRIGFVATATVATLLVATAILPFHPSLSSVLWFVGTGMHLVLSLYIISIWINYEEFEVPHTNPAWFIPVVGNLVIPLAGVHHADPSLLWFFFSIGLLFWIVLFTIVLYRILFHNPLPKKLIPTFFILMAPPSVGFLSYMKISDDPGELGRFLFSIALLMFLVVMSQYRKYLRLREFYLTWWTFSFPLAAMTLATFRAAEVYDSAILIPLAWFMVCLLTLIVLMLLSLTTRALLVGSVFDEEQTAADRVLEGPVNGGDRVR